MVNKRYVKDARVDMKIKATPPASVGFLSMGRQMIRRSTGKQTHAREYGKAELKSGVEFELISDRIYLLAITTDDPNAQIQLEISFDGQAAFNGVVSQGTSATLARIRVTTPEEA